MIFQSTASRKVMWFKSHPRNQENSRISVRLFSLCGKFHLCISPTRVMSPRANNLPGMRPLAVRDEGSIPGRSGLKNQASEQRDDFSVNRKPKGRRFLSFSRNQRKAFKSWDFKAFTMQKGSEIVTKAVSDPFECWRYAT